MRTLIVRGMEMILKNVSTDEFFEKMTDARFYRVDKYHGAIGRYLYKVDIPPEDIQGFLSGKAGQGKSWLFSSNSNYVTV